MTWQLDIDGGETPHEEIHEHAVAPGDKCPTCARRFPHPKKQSSPKSKVSAYRTPIDDAETHDATMEAWAEHWGLLQRPFWKFWLLTYAAAEALAAPPREIGDE